MSGLQTSANTSATLTTSTARPSSPSQNSSETPPACPQCGGKFVDISQGGLIEYGCSRLCGERWYPPTVYAEIVDMDEPPQRGRPPKNRRRTTDAPEPVAAAKPELCKNGHTRTTENTMIKSDGTRMCIVCRDQNAALQRKETCQRGHAMIKANVGVDRYGNRKCKACRALRDLEYRAKKRQQANKLWQQQQNGVAA